MKLTYADAKLCIEPENKDEEQQLAELLGQEYKKDIYNHIEFEKTNGEAIYKYKKGIEIYVKDAWWNRDD